MSDKAFIYMIVAIVIAHFIFAIAYLIWKIYSAPKSDNIDAEDSVERDHLDNKIK